MTRLRPGRGWLWAGLLLVGVLLAAGPGQAAPCRGDDSSETPLGVARTLVVDGHEGLALGLQTYPRTLALADHEVVLTFDDGPAAPTPRVLEALAQECVRATFFLIGRNALAHPDLVRRELAAGHSVGTHSFSHPAATLRGMDTAAAEAEITRGIAAVAEASGGARMPFFRFPGFADTPALRAWLAGQGITVFGADLWASDWRRMTPAEELALLMGRLEKAGRGIILLHDSKAQTAEMLPAFLRALKARGFRVVHIVPGARGADMGPTPVRQAPAGWHSATEAILARTLPPAAR